jgi:hypothetical protein
MRKVLVLACLGVAIAMAGFFTFKRSIWSTASGQTEPAHIVPAPQTPAPTPAVELPIARVILYSSGVGYFERQATIDGNVRLDLSFPVQDINDLLKSMVLQDQGGGLISAVNYDSHEPIDKTLTSFAVNLTSNPSFAQILGMTRGEKVEVALKNARAMIVGTVIGVDLSQPAPDKDGGNPPSASNARPVTTQRCSSVVTAYSPKRAADGVIQLIVDNKENSADSEVLNLWCPEGMRSVPVKEIERVRFVNPKMEEEIRRALEVLASAHDTQKKTVTLNFVGKGQRRVKVGYVVENPLWRTSYRLLVKKDGKLFVQGWAVVENPSNEDWKDVRMSLVSGQPISFKMDLYQPLFVPRPTVQPELYASIRPQTHGDAVATGQTIPGYATAPASGPTLAAPPVAPMPSVTYGAAPAQPVNAPFAPPSPPPAALAPGGAAPPQGQLPGQSQNINLQNGVTSAATAAELGSFFQYQVEHPVTVPRQKSAMLPIVSQPLEGAKVSLFNPNAHAKYPLLALKLKNTTGRHLTQGPVTVFEGAGYAGDALLSDLKPGEERLVSYAIDTGMEVDPQAVSASERVVRVRIHKGVLTSTTKQRQTTKYHVKNRSGHERRLLIEHPCRGDYKLVSPEKAAERTRELYRFEVKAAAGKPACLEVVEEADQVQNVPLANLNAPMIQQYLQARYSNEEVKDVLEGVLKRQKSLAKMQAEVALKQQQLQAITQDQARLRANLKEMPSSSAAYKRYLQKFDSQESEIEKLQERIKTLQAEEQQERQDCENHLNQIEVESAVRSWPGSLSIPPSPRWSVGSVP